MLEFSEDQKDAIRGIAQWLSKEDTQFITMGGYAGTGKTTIIAELRKIIHKKYPNQKVAFCSYTGKATRVLKNKLKKHKSIFKTDRITTIHSLIYSPVENKSGVIIGWEQLEKLDYDLIIVDEASMIDRNIWDDLLSYGIRIIAVGDHGQLPPIKGGYNLMQNPSLKLEKIHRQASGNKIIELSKLARESGKIPCKEYSQNIIKYDKKSPLNGEDINDLLNSYDEDTLVLCGYNATRQKLNKAIRAALEYQSPLPEVGDRVICLRNNHQQQIFNGMLGTIDYIDEEDDDWYYAEISMDDEKTQYKGKIFKSQFDNKDSLNFTDNRSDSVGGDLFDFGYAVTVHKAQGSQAKRVILFEERFSKMNDDEWRRWLYTAVTRAEEELYIIGD